MVEEKNRRSPDPTEAVAHLRRDGLEVSEEEVEFIDSLYHDPSERAEWVHTLLAQARSEFDATISDWDILCFACEFVGQQALAIQDEALHSQAKGLLRLLYSIHYSAPERLYGEPEKKPLPKEGENPDDEPEM